MRSYGLPWLAALVAATLVGLLFVAAGDSRERAFAVGPVPPHGVAAVLNPGEQACQGPMDVAAPASEARLILGTPSGSGPPIRITIVDLDEGRREVASSLLAGGYPDGSTEAVSFPPLEEGAQIEFCLENTGGQPASLYGSLPPSDRPPYADRPAPNSSSLPTSGGEPGNVLSVDFLREEESTALSLLPEIFRRAALFRPGWIGAWTFWLLFAALMTVLPLLLALALRAASRETATGEPAQKEPRPVSHEPPSPPNLP